MDAVGFGETKERVNFYYLYGEEVQGNVLNAALLETFIASWILPLIGRYLIAPFQKTQVRLRVVEVMVRVRVMIGVTLRVRVGARVR